MSQTYEPAAVMPPPPETLSEQARVSLAAAAAAVPADLTNIDSAMMRMFAEQIQLGLGAEQQKAYPVTITDDVVAGVPVRRIVRASGEVDRKRVLMNLHGGGFAVDAGSLTENIPLAAISGIQTINTHSHHG